MTMLIFVYLFGVLTGIVFITVLAMCMNAASKKKKDEEAMQNRTFYNTKIEPPEQG